MKKLLLLIIALISASGISNAQNIKPEKSYYNKFFSLKAGISISSDVWYAPIPMVGPDIGVAWENWKTPKRGFTTELHLVFPQSLGNYSNWIQGFGYVSVPLLWNFRMKEKWVFKTGFQPNLIFYIVNENRDGPHMFFCPDIQIPVCFSYHPTKRFSLDFKLSLGLVGAFINIPSIYIFLTPLPIHSSISVTAGWKLFKE